MTARAKSLMRYTSLPRKNVKRDAIFANRAQLPARETVATQQNSLNSHWRILVSYIDRGPFRHAQNFGDMGANFRFFGESSRAGVAKE